MDFATKQNTTTLITTPAPTEWHKYGCDDDDEDENGLK